VRTTIRQLSVATIATVALALSACSPQSVVQLAPPPQPEPTFQGRSLSDWTEALKDSNPKTRVGAAWALGRIGPSAAPAVPALIEALSDPDKLVRTQSIAALGKIGPGAAAAIPSLDQLATDNDWATRKLASAALAAIQGKAPPNDDAREKMPSRSRAPHPSPPSS